MEGRSFAATFIALGCCLTTPANDDPPNEALGVMNGPEMELATDLSNGPLLRALEAPIFTNRERVNILFLATLSRLPRDDERLLFLDRFEQPNSSQLSASSTDMLWALLNSSEFSLNH